MSYLNTEDLELSDGDYCLDEEVDYAPPPPLPPVALPLGVWRPSEGNWYIGNTSGTTLPGFPQQWGWANDIPVPGRYRGNGGTSTAAVWQPSTGEWIIAGANGNGTQIIQWGQAGDIPVPADYSGSPEHYTDIAVFRPSNGVWYFYTPNAAYGGAVAWGQAGDVPIPGQYNNTSAIEIGVYRPSTTEWFIPGIPVITCAINDIPVPGNYNETPGPGEPPEGASDIVVWRPSTGEWIIPTVGTIAQWGGPGDIPMYPADWLGNGHIQLVVYRPSNSNWYIRQVANPAKGIPEIQLGVPYGAIADIPLGLPYSIQQYAWKQAGFAPTNLVVLEGSDVNALLSWSAAPGATSYNIKRSLTGNAPYTTLATGVTDTNYTDEGLTGGAWHYYVVSATNLGGESGDSARNQAYIHLPAPTNPTATVVSTSQIDLAWTEVASATSYNIQRYSSAGGGWTTIATGVTGNIYSDTGLLSGVTYNYIIQAVNANGVSNYSGQSSSTLAPAAPTSLAATVFSSSQINLTWGSSAGAASYNIKRATVNGGPYVTVATVPGSNISYGDTSLNSNTTYYYVVSAVNGSGESPSSAQSSALSKLAPPTNLGGIPVSPTQINLVWTASPDATSYNIKRTTVNGGAYTTIASGITVVSYQNTGLSANTTYYYAVSAVNGTRVSDDAVIGGIITPPVSPTGLTAAFITTTQINLAWTASAGAYRYNVKRAAASGGPYTTIATNLQYTNYFDAGLTTDTTYYYVVTAVNINGGESANSSQLTVKTYPPQWEFSMTEGWINGGGFTSVSSDGSNLVATGMASGSWIYNPSVGNFGYKGKATDQIRVRVYPTGGLSASHNMKIYFKPGASSTWAETNALQVNYSASNQWVDVIFPIGGVSGWSGQTISQLRVNFDAINLLVSSWKIDYIRIE